MNLFPRILTLFLLFATFALPSLSDSSFSNRYRSPRNSERPVRKSTTLIVLHTTEAPSGSALPKLCAMGECHYCIDERGKVYRIIDHRREAFHAGRSMWRGRTNVDAFSVGIEVCGYHNRALAEAQYRALADLIAELKFIYKIKDSDVVTHSQVAYGTPNKWIKRNHRGRKRCGMNFALPSIRKKLHLKSRTAFDPDVKARRLIVGDAYLAKVLYGRVTPSVEKPAPQIRAVKRTVKNKHQRTERGAKKVLEKRVVKSATRKKKAAPAPPTHVVATKETPRRPQMDKPAPKAAEETDEIEIIAKKSESNVIAPGRTAWDIARGAYNHKSTIYRLPDGTMRAGHQIIDFKDLPPGTVVNVAQNDDEVPDSYQTLGINGTAREIAGDEALAFSTLYVCPDGHFFRGSQLNERSLQNLKYGTRILTGYAVGGPVTDRLSPVEICGAKWNAEDTFYKIHGQLIPGPKVDSRKLPAGTMIFYKN